MLCKCSGKYIDIYFILKITFRQRPAVLIEFPCFLSGFFLASFPLFISALFTRGVFCLRLSVLPDCLSLQTALPVFVCPSAPFLHFYPPFPILSKQFGYSGYGSRICIRLSVIPNFFGIRRYPIVAVGFAFFLSFVFLPSLPCSPAFSCLFVFLFCRTVYRYMRLSFFFSPFTSLALAYVLRLPFLRFVCRGRVLLVGFLSFDSFRLWFFPLRDAILFACWYVPFHLVASTWLFSGHVSLFFSFCVHRYRFHCFVSCFVHPSSMFRFVSCFAFLFVLPICRTFWFSSYSFGVVVFLPLVDSGRVFRALFATFLSCSISWSSSLRFSSVISRIR